MGRREYVSDGLRLDGRRPKELRNIKLQIGVLGSADGSAMFQMGNTQVCGGARGAHGGDRWCDACPATDALEPTAGMPRPPPPQVLASVFGPREVELRSELKHDRAIVKCEYAMAAFSTGAARAGARSAGAAAPPAVFPPPAAGSSRRLPGRGRVPHATSLPLRPLARRQASGGGAGRRTGARRSSHLSSATRWRRRYSLRSTRAARSTSMCR
jgi:hypothetical protein